MSKTFPLVLFSTVSLFFICLINITNTQAQFSPDRIKISQVDVSNLSTAEIAQIVEEIDSRQLSDQEFTRLAEAQGASPSQVAALMSRIKEYRLQIPKQQQVNTQGQKDRVDTGELSKRTQKGVGPGKAGIYGVSIFNSKNLSFQPSTNIPTPKNYQLGPGDEIVIEIWGTSRQSYRKFISKNGTVNIGNLGPIYLNGMTVKAASQRIKQRLSSIYRGLTSKNPTTFYQFSLGQLRSINVMVLGEVATPGNYTVSSLATAFNAIYLSGGPSKNGSLRNIEVIRENKVISKIDVYDFLMSGVQDQNIRLRDQDIIRINSYETRVSINGEVKRPMKYEMLPGETLADLVRYASGYTQDAYTFQMNVKRKSSRDLEIISLNQDEIKEFALHNGDVVDVESIIQRYSNRVEIVGAVYRAGEFELDSGMTIGNLIRKAEGLRDFAYTERGLLRRTLEDYTKEIISFDVAQVLKDPSNDIILRKDDIVEIKSKDQMQERMYVRISGEVLNTGEFEFHENMTVSDLIVMANGFKESALRSKIEIARRIKDKEEQSGDLSEIHTITISESLGVNSERNPFYLEPYDLVFVRKDPNYEEQESISLRGEIQFPGTYVINNSEEFLSDVIERAGGLTNFAYMPGATFRRKSLSDSVKLAIDLKEILSNPHSENDLIVKSGDVFHVPSKLQTVSVEGAVFNAIAVKYDPQSNLSDYIDFSGGYIQNAKKSKVFITYANGISKRVKRRLILFKSYPKVRPGSKIFVPHKAPRKQSGRTQEVLAFTTGVATVALLIQRIFQ